MLGRRPPGVAWGALSDARGRRPALLLTFFGILVGNVAFGLCTTLRQALVVRFVFLGMGNGWVALIGPMSQELGGAERQSEVLALIFASGPLSARSGRRSAVCSTGRSSRRCLRSRPRGPS